ncbi:hypothetical protein [Tateyamaria sp.]|uniref:hypothetical protein n=1 Tax=Tateyamaria sp. TaxID=1929288 RepID=UPI0032A04BA7
MITTDQTEIDMQKVCEILRQRLYEIDRKEHCDVTYWAEHRAAINACEEIAPPQPIPATTEVLEAERLTLTYLLRVIIVLGGALDDRHLEALRRCASSITSAEGLGVLDAA